MNDFLLELRCEEIPARMQAGARGELEKLFRKAMDAAGVLRQAQDERDLEVTVWSTPRRLALIARGLPQSTEAVREETKGPRTSAPEQALEGFLRKTGLTKDQLEDRDGVWFAVVEKPGQRLREVLAQAIPTIVRGFAWPKSMRWGAASVSTDSLRWVRPLSGIVAILGEDLVECEVGGIASGYATLGHRFHHTGVSPEKVGTGFSASDATHGNAPITIGGADDYQEKLRACHVIVDHEERQDLIRTGAARAAAEAGLTLVEDEGLVIENAGLTEWPVPLLGRFDQAFLDVPPEVIQLTARVNQKYFVCRKPLPLRGGVGVGDVIASPDSPHPPTPSPEGEGESAPELANAFVCTANIEAADGGTAIVDGNRKVLAARLSDARFFWEQDRKTPLAEHAKKLERITFHEKLGTVADKVERVAMLARWLVEEGIIKPLPFRGGVGVGAVAPQTDPDSPHSPTLSPEGEREQLADLAEAAARLCKADLVTEMVGEFPELQGVMGGYYASAEGLPNAVAAAIRDHYKPVGQGDDVPTAPVTVAVSLADKLDTLVGFFAIGEKPTGSKDPFALRRAAIGVLQLLAAGNLRVPLKQYLEQYYRAAIAAPPYRRMDHSQRQEASEGKYVLHLNREIEPVWLEYLDRVDDEFWRLHEATMDELDLWQRFELHYLNMNDWKAKFGETWDDHPPTELWYLGSYIQTIDTLLDFFADRLKVQQREAGVRHDLIDAVFALGGEDDLVRLLARVHALQSFVGTEDGANLLAGYKRAANILKKEGWSTTSPLPAGEGPGVGVATPASAETPTQPSPERGRAPAEDANGIPQTGEEDPLALVDDPDMKAVIAAKMAEGRAKELSYTHEPAEDALIAALDSAEPRAAAAVEAEDFAAAMAALAGLRAPIDRFFEEVTVNDDDSEKRAARLDLLQRFRDAVHQVADFSRIEG